ncbi:MAG: hypothetical protein ABGY75_04605 [Gemmataceae bacterium]
MTAADLYRHRTDVLRGVVTVDFYQLVYLPYALAGQTRAVENLQRVSKGRVSASVLIGAKKAAAPMAYRALADTVAVMSGEQLAQFVEQVFDAAGVSVPTV